MPTVSMFFGVIIRMYWNDHMPPHFHAYYQGDSAVFDLDGNLLEGSLPKKQTSFVVAWCAIHRDEPCTGPLFGRYANLSLSGF